MRSTGASRPSRLPGGVRFAVRFAVGVAVAVAAVGSAACGGDDEVLPIDAARAADARAATDAPAVADAADPPDGSIADASVSDATTVDAAVGPDADFAGEGEVCARGPDGPDAGVRMCEPGLVCCYPCGIPGCSFQCTVPCDAGPACSGGCLLVP